MQMHFVFESPVGNLLLTEQDEKILSLVWTKKTASTPKSSTLRKTKRWLTSYFCKNFIPINFSLGLEGTKLQKNTWKSIYNIPFSQTTTYGQLAKIIGTSPRAIGRICGSNPIPIIIPCHRVLSSNGTMGGYSGGKGITTKQKLLKLENSLI